MLCAFMSCIINIAGIEALKETLAGCGFDVDITSSASIQASLQRLRAQCNDDDIAQVGWHTPNKMADN